MIYLFFFALAFAILQPKVFLWLLCLPFLAAIYPLLWIGLHVMH